MSTSRVLHSHLKAKGINWRRWLHYPRTCHISQSLDTKCTTPARPRFGSFDVSHSSLFAVLHGYLAPVDINLEPLGNRFSTSQLPVTSSSLMDLLWIFDQEICSGVYRWKNVCGTLFQHVQQFKLER